MTKIELKEHKQGSKTICSNWLENPLFHKRFVYQSLHTDPLFDCWSSEIQLLNLDFLTLIITIISNGITSSMSVNQSVLHSADIVIL